MQTLFTLFFVLPLIIWSGFGLLWYIRCDFNRGFNPVKRSVAYFVQGPFVWVGVTIINFFLAWVPTLKHFEYWLKQPFPEEDTKKE